METKLYTSVDIQEAAQKIKQGDLIAFPTETVYGLGADATNEAAVQKVYAAKGRPSDNPLIVHVANFSEVAAFVEEIPGVAEKLAQAFWPGPLTLILPIRADSLSAVVTGGLATAAFRQPNQADTLALIRAAGVPLVGPSANTSGKPSPTTAEHVYHDLHGKIAGIIDGGPTAFGLESTVVDLSDVEKGPLILRPGAVTPAEIQAVIGESVPFDQHVVNEAETPKAPGMKYQHYAPSVPVYMIDADQQNWSQAVAWAEQQGEKVGLLATAPTLEKVATKSCQTFALSATEHVQEASQKLFAGLRYFDEPATDVTIVFAETFPNEGFGMAYMNRLQKASGHRFFSEKNL